MSSAPSLLLIPYQLFFGNAFVVFPASRVASQPACLACLHVSGLASETAMETAGSTSVVAAVRVQTPCGGVPCTCVVCVLPGRAYNYI